MAAMSSGVIWRCPVAARISAWRRPSWPASRRSTDRRLQGLPRLEAFPVLADLGVILGDPRAGRFHLRPCGGVFQRYRPLGKFGEGDVEAVRGELLGEPVIDAAEYVSFAQVDRLGVVEVVG